MQIVAMLTNAVVQLNYIHMLWYSSYYKTWFERTLRFWNVKL